MSVIRKKDAGDSYTATLAGPIPLAKPVTRGAEGRKAHPSTSGLRDDNRRQGRRESGVTGYSMWEGLDEADDGKVGDN